MAGKCLLPGHRGFPFAVRPARRHVRRPSGLQFRDSMVHDLVAYCWMESGLHDVDLLSCSSRARTCCISSGRDNAAGNHLPARSAEKHGFQFIRSLLSDWILLRYLYQWREWTLSHLEVVLLDRCYHAVDDFRGVFALFTTHQALRPYQDGLVGVPDDRSWDSLGSILHNR